MKNVLLLVVIWILGMQQNMACSWYEPDYEYFNLFTQTIIQDKSYTPFLLTYSNPYYVDEGVQMPDDNISAWQKYFDNQLSFAETKRLIYDISLEDLNHLKFKRSLNGPILQKLGYDFYTQYQDAVDYLIEAKYIQPYMRIQHVENPNAWSSYDKKTKTAADLNFNKISSDLKNLYHATTSKEIKLRYGYQLVRFYHYNRKYRAAIQAFNQYVKPHKTDSAPYYMALDQMAGAQRGLGMLEEANWNFFQVFKHSNSRKQSAYGSMTLTTEVSFQDLLERSKTKEDKILAYFLLAYQNFNNPLPMMEKIYALDPTSEVLMVLEARAINELERQILPTYNQVKANTVVPGQKPKDVTKDPRRIPIVVDNQKRFNVRGAYEDTSTLQYLTGIASFTQKMKTKSHDAFWDISAAYLKFLQQDHSESLALLNSIQTTNTAYQAQIQKMKMLNDIAAQPYIDAAFEEHLMQAYAPFLERKLVNEDDYYVYQQPSTEEFIEDVLANRYYIQGAYAKSFLMSQELSHLKWNPDFQLTKKLEAYYNKKNKSSFEQHILNKKIDVKDPKSFFNLIYGDYYARNAQFKKALKSYQKVSNGTGFIPTEIREYNYDKNDYDIKPYPKDQYNYFNNVSPYIFGHHQMVFYNNAEENTMQKEPFANEFPFIQKRQNKAELMQNLIKLEKIAKGRSSKAAKANQLIGNVLYNTSKVGYYRHIFLFDINNGRSLKFDYNPITYNVRPIYYKHFPNEYKLEGKQEEMAEKYYQKALKLSKSKEQKARILFQLANVEQAQFYQWTASLPEIPYNYDTEDYKEYQRKVDLRQAKIDKVLQEKFKTYFSQIEAGYTNTQTIQQIRSNCKYLDSYLQN